MMLRLETVLSKGPTHLLAMARWYTRRLVQRSITRPAPAVAEPASLLSKIDLTRPGLEAVRCLVSNGETTTALAQLAGYFRARTQPVFFFDDQSQAQIIDLVSEVDRQATLAVADEICRLIFQFRGEPPVRFEEAINWTHQPRQNQDWTWDLNRQIYLMTLGRAYAYSADLRYARQCRTLLLDWLAHNPPLLDHPNWREPLEVAIRISVWAWAFYHFRHAPVFDNETLLACLHGIEVHGRYLAANLEYHVPNNHLLSEAKALVLCGTLFPEFQEAGQWRKIGLQILWREVLRQVCADGVHGELATCYHRVVLGELLEIFVLLENNNEPIPPAVLERFSRMLDYEAAITKPDGSIPLLGDSALADTLIRWSPLSGGLAFLGRADLAAPDLDEVALWLLGPERAARFSQRFASAQPPQSKLFPEGGYAVMRQDQAEAATYLVFDCGPFGYPPAPGHGHADALSIELYAQGNTLVLDPGVYGYFLGAAWRNFFRGTHAHNTVVVDDQDQSHLLDTWRVHRPARSTLHRWLSHPAIDFADASHNGYTRLPEPIIHRRQILFVKGEYWVIVDRLEGRGIHQFDLLFHLPAAANITPDAVGDGFRVALKDQAGLLIAPATSTKSTGAVICGQTEPIQGWVSLYSGHKEAAPVIVFRQTTQAPTCFCTVLYPYPQNALPSVRVSPLVVEGGGAVGVHLVTDEREDWVMMRADDLSTPTVAFAGFQTDARIALVRRQRDSETLARIILGDGSHLSRWGQRIMAEAQLSPIVEWSPPPHKPSPCLVENVKGAKH